MYRQIGKVLFLSECQGHWGHLRFSPSFRVKWEFHKRTLLLVPIVSTCPEITGREVKSLSLSLAPTQVTMRQESRLGWPSLRLSDA